MTSRGRRQSWISFARKSSTILAVATSLLTFAIQKTNAQTFTVLHSFTGGADGSRPVAGLVRDGAGNLYGTTIAGGTANQGVVFKIDSHGTETVLYSFAGGIDGSEPKVFLKDKSGNLYGTTADGGPADAGTVFKIDAAGVKSIFYAFSGGADGSSPAGTLLQDKAGNFYGSAFAGGNLSCNPPGGCGVVFKIDGSGNETVLHAFAGGIDDGSFPMGSLALDNKGLLYGTTFEGGKLNDGTIFVVNTADGTEGVLFRDFGRYAFRLGGVIGDSKGNLYGTSQFGGVLQGLGCQAFGCGTVFEFQADGYLNLLHKFLKGTDGAFPVGLLRDKAGNLYGVANAGGTGGCRASGCGTIYKIDPAGSFSVIHTFTGTVVDGASPESTLIADPQGNLYGTASQGGALNKGIVFEVAP